VEEEQAGKNPVMKTTVDWMIESYVQSSMASMVLTQTPISLISVQSLISKKKQ
jgi:hypothetical protein